MNRLLSSLAWLAVALVGAGALGAIALWRGEPVNGVFFVVGAGCTYLVAYRFYSAFLAARVLVARRHPRDARRSGSTTGATSCPPTAGWCSATTSPPSRARGRSSAPPSPRSSATCRGRCGSSWARSSAAACRTS